MEESHYLGIDDCELFGIFELRNTDYFPRTSSLSLPFLKKAMVKWISQWLYYSLHYYQIVFRIFLCPFEGESRNIRYSTMHELWNDEDTSALVCAFKWHLFCNMQIVTVLIEPHIYIIIVVAWSTCDLARICSSSKCMEMW